MNKAKRIREIEKRADELLIECQNEVWLRGYVADTTLEELKALGDEREKLEAEE